jgi:hypothetical protein
MYEDHKMKHFTHHDSTYTFSPHSHLHAVQQDDLNLVPELSVHNISDKSSFLEAANRCGDFIRVSPDEVIMCLPSSLVDRLCGLVVRVPGYRSRGFRFDSRRCQIF